ncbi:spermidine/putrescine transport system permease protein [Tistlia consotensis]|uniref:Spermidine/putrescine transport system permease protein n=1 Tax=Tistlia consotensis USBA 355 TaxID=560819 RepID=A0A1Y6C615_9PROT|nr:ABC transporter permease [Tistlia consotensis]SMF38225.1 spermidine/putrescine transport system permease protein [Tistlia consotensis USBA 355]SNR37309.1 spermidine/putrescine transport system permease protein [Tistlia consotensis]
MAGRLTSLLGFGRDEPIGPLDYGRRWWMRLIVGLTFVFLYAPIVVLIAYSFNDSRRNIVWVRFTTDWYVKAIHDQSLLVAFGNSLTIAIINTLLSTVLGTLTALLLWRFRFPLRPVYEGAIALPIVIPEICMGVAMMAFFAWIGWPNDLPWPISLSNIVIAHVAFSFPFVAVIIRARLAGFNRELEDAAKDLGATEWRTLLDIIVPYLKPALVAGALISFTLSLDDFVITFFTAGPDTITLPVKIFSMVRFSVTPEVNAASTVLVVITVVTTVLALRLQNAGQKAGSSG